MKLNWLTGSNFIKFVKTIGLFSSSPPPLIFSEIHYIKVYLKWFFMLETAIKRVGVNSWTNFYNISNMQIAVWTIFEHLCFVI